MMKLSHSQSTCLFTVRGDEKNRQARTKGENEVSSKDNEMRSLRAVEHSCASLY